MLESASFIKKQPQEATLILLTRYPVAGKAKTRLIPALGTEGAAKAHRQMTEAVLLESLKLAQAGVGIEVHGFGAQLEDFSAWLGQGVSYYLQRPGDLGEKMDHALNMALIDAEKVCLIGSDCPQITVKLLKQAFDLLDSKDLVLGPSLDGGYYLVGLKKPTPGIFREIAWGSERVLEQSLEKAQSLGLKVGLLQQLQDVDEPEDLKVWQRVQQERGL